MEQSQGKVEESSQGKHDNVEKKGQYRNLRKQRNQAQAFWLCASFVFLHQPSERVVKETFKKYNDEAKVSIHSG